MKKHTFLIFVIICLFNFTHAQEVEQDTSTSVDLIAYWDKGDSYQYKITKIDIDSLNNQQVKDIKQSYIAQLTVLDSLEDGFRIEWKYLKKIDTVKIQIPEELVMQAMELNNFNLIFKTDIHGSFIGIENYQKVSEFMSSYLNKIIKDTSDDNPNTITDVDKARMQLLANYFQSKEGIENFIFPEVKAICSLFGGNYSIKDTLSYESQLPNPIMKTAPLLAHSQFYCNYYDKKFVSFYIYNHVDRESYLNMVKELYKGSKINENDFDKIDCNIMIKSYNAYHLPYGIPAEAESERLIKVIDEKGTKFTKQTKVLVEMLYDEDEGEDEDQK